MPRLTGGCAGLVALVLAQSEGGHADVGQGQGGVGGRGRGVAAQELPAYALQLPAVGQLSTVEVEVRPVQTEGFTLAQDGRRWTPVDPFQQLGTSPPQPASA